MFGLMLLMFSTCYTLRRLSRFGLLSPPPLPSTWSPPPALWYTQKLDHFRLTDSRTWQQRYFVNATFRREGGPVFVMIGGEGEANPAWMMAGTWIEYARQMGAICFMLEHRFYGQSRPTRDMSVKSLRFLSSSQALADLASFTQSMTSQYKLFGSRWVAFGGSYPGSLSAWYRLKYPHLIHCAVSTSAPMLAQADFSEYLQVVTSSLKLGWGVDCVGGVARAFSSLHRLHKHRDSWPKLNKIFRLCEPLSSDNWDYFISLLAGYFEETVQYSGDNRGFEGGVNTSIQDICELMIPDHLDSESNSDIGSLAGLAALNTVLLLRDKQTCLQNNPLSELTQLRNVKFDSDSNNGARQWLYQTCTEFGWYQTTDSDSQSFGRFLSLNQSVQQCTDVFGKRFDEALVNEAVRATNMKYGGRDFVGSRVVFLNGNVDPWHAMGFTTAPTRDNYAIYINGTAHCANMYPASASDPPQLTQARIEVALLVSDWINQ